MFPNIKMLRPGVGPSLAETERKGQEVSLSLRCLVTWRGVVFFCCFLAWLFRRSVFLNHWNIPNFVAFNLCGKNNHVSYSPCIRINYSDMIWYNSHFSAEFEVFELPKLIKPLDFMVSMSVPTAGRVKPMSQRQAQAAESSPGNLTRNPMTSTPKVTSHVKVILGITLW